MVINNDITVDQNQNGDANSNDGVGGSKTVPPIMAPPPILQTRAAEAAHLIIMRRRYSQQMDQFRDFAIIGCHSRLR